MHRILIVGANAREHAIAKSLLRSRHPLEIMVLATHDHAVLRDVSSDFCITSWDDKLKIVEFVKRHAIQFAIIGGEIPLASGIVDLLSDSKVQCVGPYQYSARIETSKGYARDLMKRFGIDASPSFHLCSNRSEWNALRSNCDMQQIVIKADGLMGGKGVSVGGEHFFTEDEANALVDDVFSKNQSIVVEEKLIGEEFSLMAFCDGETIVPMPCVRDFKRAFEGNTGPNTGGMGSYSLANHRLPFLTEADVSSALEIMHRAIAALQHDTSERYCGVLYGGFIKTQEGIQVIEFNARCGDPEILNVLSILQTDFFDVIQAMTSGSLRDVPVRFAKLATVCKYVVPCDYPNVRAPAEKINFRTLLDDPHVYLGSFSRNENGDYFTSSSRTLAYVGAGDTIESASQHVERAISKITGTFRYRRDIPFVECV